MQASRDRIMSVSTPHYQRPIPSPSIHPHHTHLEPPEASGLLYRSRRPSNTDSIDMQASRAPHSAPANLTRPNYGGTRANYPSPSKFQPTPGMYTQIDYKACEEQLPSETIEHCPKSIRAPSSGHGESVSPSRGLSSRDTHHHSSLRFQLYSQRSREFSC